MYKSPAKIVKKHVTLAGHRASSNHNILHRRWLPKVSINV
jgi:hypothetical protein